MNAMHRLGRAGVAGAILLMLGMPLALGLYFDALPSVGKILQAAVPLLVVFVPSGFAEVLYYTPIMGSSVYLALITGEIINLKWPVINNAIKISNISPGTEDAEVISSIAAGTASLIVVALVTACIVLSIPLQPFLTMPAVRTASANVFPALFGAMVLDAFKSDLGSGIRASGRWKSLLFPLLLVAGVTFFDAELSAFLHLDTLVGQAGTGVIMSVYPGFVIILMLPVVYYTTKLLYKKGKIHIRLPEKT
ncbi:MAG: hypothetical protein LBH54_00530 [Clostridiales bacterium]|jgi:hypothetical protein|nr:hypothetical protein [Clostridiales bacterium]